MLNTLVILGAAGDLAARYLLPSLVRLHAAKALPGGFRVRGLARNDWTSDDFRAHMDARLAEMRDPPAGSRRAILQSLEYRVADTTSARDVRQALEDLDTPLVAYLALPPFVFGGTIEALNAADLPRGSRIVVEKPFGEDRASAGRLNALIHEKFPEDAVFRIDHFLAMRTVQNILGLRFANRIFEPVWNGLHIEKVEIVWDETLTIEGRASYDQVGALRDVVQNHLLQVLCLIAMEAPTTLEARDLRDRKFDVLRAVRRFSLEEAAQHSVRGRYGAGRIDGREVSAYVDEPGVDASRATETFAAVTLFIDNWRWAGVPFLLRSGKALGDDRKAVVVHFRRVPHLAFCQPEEPEPNVLCIRLEPGHLSLGVNLNETDTRLTVRRRSLTAELASGGYTAYGRLLLDMLAGDPTLSIRDDEAEEAWRIIEPVMEAWERGSAPLQEYAAGSSGPVRDERRG